MQPAIKAPPFPAKAPPFPKRRETASALAADDFAAILPATATPIPDYVLSADYADALARDHLSRNFSRRYLKTEGSAEEQQKRLDAAARYYARLAEEGTISRETAAKWTDASTRFAIEVVLIARDALAEGGVK